MKPTMPSRFVTTALGAVALLLALFASAAMANETPGGSAIETQARALQKAHHAVIGLRAQAVEDARSAQTLGRVRQGSGVVIGNDGLVLTIGYLILEADHVELEMSGERVVPARVVAYDLATGFGLVRALVPLRIDPAPLGEARRVTSDEPLLIASGGDDGDVSMARLMSRRPFSGYWEYHIDGALFTSPPRTDHSGAALINSHGEVVGIGSLIVSDSLGPGQPRVPGNMFVPIDLLKPIFAELQAKGSSSLSRRAWIGINCAEVNGEVRVIRVNSDSPADVAGLQVGDRIVRIDGTEIQALEPFYRSLWNGGPPEREVTLDVLRDGSSQTLKVQAVDRMKTLKHATGV